MVPSTARIIGCRRSDVQPDRFVTGPCGTAASSGGPASYDDSAYDDDDPLWLYCAKQVPFTAWPTGPQPRQRPVPPKPPWLAELSAKPPALSPDID